MIVHLYVLAVRITGEMPCENSIKKYSLSRTSPEPSLGNRDNELSPLPECSVLGDGNARYLQDLPDKKESETGMFSISNLEDKLFHIIWNSTSVVLVYDIQSIR